jgi:hypothetical protein
MIKVAGGRAALGPNALHQVALARYAYQVDTAAMRAQQARGGGTSILIAAGVLAGAAVAFALIPVAAGAVADALGASGPRSRQRGLAEPGGSGQGAQSVG